MCTRPGGRDNRQSARLIFAPAFILTVPARDLNLPVAYNAFCNGDFGYRHVSPHFGFSFTRGFGEQISCGAVVRNDRHPLNVPPEECVEWLNLNSVNNSTINSPVFKLKPIPGPLSHDAIQIF
ncbi:hypothetical protein EVAR_9158_1 [Eumeta japonica]|uniref:Uncharacterized protein n=1 Tax=Eumeta variegata TaxID=151549 RepID=A0A4C1TW87_EUMVA|nr:hypothetical protein EVAR_9158_1 [Eumeta japonica]